MGITQGRMEITLESITDQYLRGELSEEEAIELAVLVLKRDNPVVPIQQGKFALTGFMRRYNENIIQTLAEKFKESEWQ